MLDFKKCYLIGAVLSGALILSACNLYKTPATTTGPAEQQQGLPVPQENVITYSDGGFAPSPIKVKVGQTVSVKNSTAANIQVNSAPHPVHTLYPEFNIGTIAPGETKSVTLTTAGTRKYHNHLNPSQFGQIDVE